MNYVTSYLCKPYCTVLVVLIYLCWCTQSSYFTIKSGEMVRSKYCRSNLLVLVFFFKNVVFRQGITPCAFFKSSKQFHFVKKELKLLWKINLKARICDNGTHETIWYLGTSWYSWNNMVPRNQLGTPETIWYLGTSWYFWNNIVPRNQHDTPETIWYLGTS